MAYINASFAVDTFNIDLNFYSRNFYDSEFQNDIYFRYAGRTYEDLFAVNGWSGSIDLVLGLGGYGFRFNSYGEVVAGTVTGLVETTFDDTELWRAQDFQVPARDVYAVVLTPGGSDDRRLLDDILAGNDRIDLSRFADRFESSSGKDIVWGRGGDDVLFGEGGDDKLYGNSGRDVVFGGKGSDNIFGGSGEDSLSGGGGNDRISGDNNSDIIAGGGGNDQLDGGHGRDLLNGGSGRDRILGGAGNDVLKGSGSSDFLSGGQGADKLVGGAGGDKIIGGTGPDVLIGGGGGDTFVFSKSSGDDRVVDFGSGDIAFIQSGAKRMRDLIFSESDEGLIVEFGGSSILLKGLEREDVHSSNFDFI